MTNPNTTRQGDLFKLLLMSTLVGLMMFGWLSRKLDSEVQAKPTGTSQTVEWRNPSFRSLKQVSGGTSAGVR
ncbi:hypothetical protein [Leptolyngbya sp. NIES-2104]|uniref:hypothetical protein n=1 Tax=Leptolyngbya sp. NIES-2104 TaxID=1552121 RepID=UPI0006EC75FD|nr:hypothetical protein [Leptolyngbya sp. NIES-2104]GAP93863.1 hypothetical protein NIES2104_03720 [Leptolyngbya sp. NIES-2104]